MVLYNFRNGAASTVVDNAPYLAPHRYNDLAPSAGILRIPDDEAVEFIRAEIESIAKEVVGDTGNPIPYTDYLSIAEDTFDGGRIGTWKLTASVNGGKADFGFLYVYVNLYNFSANPRSEAKMFIERAIKEG